MLLKSRGYLKSEGERVPLVILFMANGSAYRDRHWQRLSGILSALHGDEPVERDERFLHWRRHVAFLVGSARHYATAARELMQKPFPEQSRRVAGKMRRIMSRATGSRVEPPVELPPLEKRFWDLYRDASESYVPSWFNGRLILLWPREERVAHDEDPDYGWNAVSPDVRLIYVPGDHDSSITQSANLAVAGQEMRRALDEADTANVPAEAPPRMP